MLGEPAVSSVSNCVSGTDSVDSTCSVRWRHAYGCGSTFLCLESHGAIIRDRLLSLSLRERCYKT